MTKSAELGIGPCSREGEAAAAAEKTGAAPPLPHVYLWPCESLIKSMPETRPMCRARQTTHDPIKNLSQINVRLRIAGASAHVLGALVVAAARSLSPQRLSSSIRPGGFAALDFFA